MQTALVERIANVRLIGVRALNTNAGKYMVGPRNRTWNKKVYQPYYRYIL